MYKVMFVDDEPWAVIDIMHSTPWESTGFSVAGYWDKPTAALEEIVKGKPDLVFTDICMPVLDGFELIKRCREAGSQAEFIILSSYSDFLYAKQAIKSAVLDYCLKPVNPAVLLEILEEIRALLDERNAPIKTMQNVQTDDSQHSSFDDILEHIRENFQNKMLLSHLADHFHFNKNYICHLFKKHANTTFSNYLTQVRIESAKKLLRESALSQSEIAAQVGFADHYYFNRVFKAECGYTPSQYRHGKSKEALS